MLRRPPPPRRVAPGMPVRAGAPVLRSSRTQLNWSCRETERAGNTSSSAARPSLLRNVGRVSRERSVREDQLLCASVVIEITRSQRGSDARRLLIRSSVSHPALVCAMESVGSSTMTRNDSTTPPRSIRSRVWSAWTDSAACGSQSPRGRLVSNRLTCQASRSKAAPIIRGVCLGAAPHENYRHTHAYLRS